ncbi:hypothetical protein BA190_31945 [Labrys sp. WJW]|uniref:hypothetical protein n=1 Tax=Labrys sp. WJW TaxID=1737983 RepID=UPI00082F3F36|nr:hypothetical protein [Labrys sp. WJW]OCC00790.1 hypothetical protein BA190_31945 [Labrys sp. WJW]
MTPVRLAALAPEHLVLVQVARLAVQQPAVEAWRLGLPAPHLPPLARPAMTMAEGEAQPTTATATIGAAAAAVLDDAE